MKTKFSSRPRWREKLEKPQKPKIVQIPPKMSRFGSGTMLMLAGTVSCGVVCHPA